jgi:hypothetical protein
VRKLDLAENKNPYCQKCLEEDKAKGVPPIKRRVQPLPCPIHSGGGFISPHLLAWLNFYAIVSPYSAQTLDHQLISKICLEYDLRFTDAFYWLSLIHREFLKKHDKRNRQSTEADEGQSKSF